MDYMDFFVREQVIAASEKIDFTADFPYQRSWSIEESQLVMKMEKGCQDVEKQWMKKSPL